MSDVADIAISYAFLGLGCVIYLLVPAPVIVIALSCLPGVFIFTRAYIRRAREVQEQMEAFFGARSQDK